jgi:hypothetical protein
MLTAANERYASAPDVIPLEKAEITAELNNNLTAHQTLP